MYVLFSLQRHKYSYSSAITNSFTQSHIHTGKWQRFQIFLTPWVGRTHKLISELRDSALDQHNIHGLREMLQYNETDYIEYILFIM